jgi:hypothetical protein
LFRNSRLVIRYIASFVMIIQYNIGFAALWTDHKNSHSRKN